ncbi:MAG: ABC transporter permease [Bacteroidia bacterium]
MNLFSLSWNNLKAKPLDTILSLMLLVLGVGIISLVLILNTQLDEQFKRNIRGIDMVVGAKGSPLQIILSAVYHIDNPTGNISQKEAQKLATHPLIKSSIPLAYGDNYKGFRIVGSEHSYVEHYKGELADGRLWEETLEATIGAGVAKATGLKIGDTFFSAHGLEGDDDIHTNATFTVVGILKPSGTVLDQLMLTEISSLWAVHGYAVSDTGAADTVDHQITAMLVKFRSPLGIVTIPRYVNTQTNMQASMPAFEVNRLYDNLGLGIKLMQYIAIAIIVISALSVFFSLLNSLKDRQYELALMRTMGASPNKIFGLIMLEGIILAILGFVLGLVLSRFGLWLMSVSLEDGYHYQLSIWEFLPEEGYLAIGTILLGGLAALGPAIKASTIDIHETLAEG